MKQKQGCIFINGERFKADIPQSLIEEIKKEKSANKKVQEMKFIEDISLCLNCNCMTKNKTNKHCGKCEARK